MSTDPIKEILAALAAAYVATGRQGPNANLNVVAGYLQRQIMDEHGKQTMSMVFKDADLNVTISATALVELIHEILSERQQAPVRHGDTETMESLLALRREASKVFESQAHRNTNERYAAVVKHYGHTKRAGAADRSAWLDEYWSLISGDAFSHEQNAPIPKMSPIEAVEFMAEKYHAKGALEGTRAMLRQLERGRDELREENKDPSCGPDLPHIR